MKSHGFWRENTSKRMRIGAARGSGKELKRALWYLRGVTKWFHAPNTLVPSRHAETMLNSDVRTYPFLVAGDPDLHSDIKSYPNVYSRRRERGSKKDRSRRVTRSSTTWNALDEIGEKVYRCGSIFH